MLGINIVMRTIGDKWLWKLAKALAKIKRHYLTFIYENKGK